MTKASKGPCATITPPDKPADTLPTKSKGATKFVHEFDEILHFKALHALPHTIIYLKNDDEDALLCQTYHDPQRIEKPIAFPIAALLSEQKRP